MTYMAGYYSNNSWLVAGRGPTPAAAAKALQRRIYELALKALVVHRDARLAEGYPDLTSEQMADFVDCHMDKQVETGNYRETSYQEAA